VADSHDTSNPAISDEKKENWIITETLSLCNSDSAYQNFVLVGQKFIAIFIEMYSNLNTVIVCVLKRIIL